MTLTVESIEKAIGMKAKDWVGNCYMVACRIVEFTDIIGMPRYGLYHGKISADSIFAGRPSARHGWIELPDDRICDPTRWAFECIEPYIYFGDKTEEYDLGGRTLARSYRRPFPDCDEGDKILMTIGIKPIIQFLAGVTLGDYITVKQIFWIANLTLDELGHDAETIYRWIARNGHQAFVPIDLWTKVIEG